MTNTDDLIMMPIYQQSMQQSSASTRSVRKEAQKVKVIIVGPSAVGKSSIANRFIHQIFDPRCTTTLGAAFMEKTLELPHGHFYTLQMWDTTGQEKYRAIARIYYQNAKIALLVYDVSSHHSFLDMKKWANDVISTSPKDIILAVVANKTDLLGQQNHKDNDFLGQDEGRQYAQSIGAVFHETSAKSDKGVNELFSDVCSILFKRQLSAVRSSSSIVLEVSASDNPKSCCF